MSYLHFSLQLFADEGAAADSGVAAPTAENPADSGTANQDAGEQAAPATDNQPEEPQEDTWDSLIKGKYKKEYDKAVKDAIGKRFKNQQDLQGRIDSVDPLIQRLAQRYNIQRNPDGSIPIGAIEDAMDNDGLEDEAFKRGMSVDDLKQMRSLERENAMLRQQSAKSRQEEEWTEIEREADKLKELYPDFDLDTEMQNQQFGTLLATLRNSGFPNALQQAFETVHLDDIKAGTMQYAVQRTARQIANSVQSGKSRPKENGTSGNSAANTSAVDPSKLSLKQIQEYARRAAAGEKITFT